ncbi:hypothetical protein PAESOLCIP111_01307 [Paenibacillus solanacearum]|uniref:Metallo-beta-lactamase domain-containing protein n=1 Tax=Paenibacillus solanacearum TaxID=2048548 RepID=A0A916JZP6_9BACL|nr:MBL fold metallo-hydrolase [Paenibacillus solanacearum]CAG7610921.1 hypothetical protein PAESOLCIP111_01307 [Paenibacillus solanacearum]
MKITFLGTAAAEGIPSPFCGCATCHHAREHKGVNIRKRQSVLINRDLLVDLGPDIFASCAAQGISLIEVQYLLMTHSHLDHFDATNLRMRAKPFRIETELPEMTMVAGPSVLTKWELSGGRDQEAGIKRVPFLPGNQLQLPPYSIQSIAATHNSAIGDAMNYMISDGEVSILYASDTGMYADSVWDDFKGRRFDAVVMEATLGGRPSGREHLNFADHQLMLDKLRKLGAVTDRTVTIATHFSHQSIGPHEVTERILRGMGVTCAYDGMVVDISASS